MPVRDFRDQQRPPVAPPFDAATVLPPDPDVGLADVYACRGLDMLAGGLGVAGILAAVNGQATWTVGFGLLATVALVARAYWVRGLEG